MTQATHDTHDASGTGATRGTQAAASAGLPSLLYSDTENELRAAVRALLQDRAAPAAVIARTETAETYDTGLWKALAADLGCAGLLIPESLGGAGATYREAAVVAEEIGRSAGPVPYLGSAIVATAAALSAGDDELLADLAAGTATAALAVPFPAAPGAVPAATVRVGPPRDGDPARTARLSGTVTTLIDALPADVLLVVEVSVSTLTLDAGKKLRAYARAGVPQLWIVDVDHCCVWVYSSPDGDECSYKRVETLGSGTLEAFGLQIEVAQLWPPVA